jgi:hypothetical protein
MVRVACLPPVPGRKGLSWKQYIQAHLEVRATRFNLASGIPVLCPSISEKASPSNTVRTLNGVHHRRIRAVRDGLEPFGKRRKEFVPHCGTKARKGRASGRERERARASQSRCAISGF